MPATSTILTGLSLATGIARSATDSVPIVKQVLGVASRIVGLAEQIEKNREDLHALAERAKNMDATIAAVVGDRELGHVMLRRLEAMNAILRDIEKRFAAHIKRGRVRKSLTYIFTVRKEVERLKGEFDDRLKELELAANMDTNIIAREESRFIGEFRNIRHYEINLLRHLPYLTQSCGGYTMKYHSANCEGSNEVFVVRYTAAYGRHEYHRQRSEDHESVLERMSLIQNRHPVIACLYGKNQGPRDSRFVVLKVGDIRPVLDVMSKGSADVSLVGRIAARLVVCQPLNPDTTLTSTKDACCHLQKHGAAWKDGGAASRTLFIDQNYEPRIGICDDMYSLSAWTGHPATDLVIALTNLFDLSCASDYTQEHRVPDAEFISNIWTTQLFGTLIDAGHRTLRQENIIRPAEISSLIPLSQESWLYLQQADDHYIRCTPTWGVMLSALASGTKKREGHNMHAVYYAHRSEGPDNLEVFCVDDDVDAVYHTETHFEIPRSAARKVLEELGIHADDLGDQGHYEAFNLERFRGPGAVLPICTGWIRGFGRWSPWWCAIRRLWPENHRDQFDWDSPSGVQLAEIQSGGDAE